MQTLELTEQEAAYLAWVLNNLFAGDSELGQVWVEMNLSDSARSALGRVKGKLALSAWVKQEWVVSCTTPST